MVSCGARTACGLSILRLGRVGCKASKLLQSSEAPSIRLVRDCSQRLALVVPRCPHRDSRLAAGPPQQPGKQSFQNYVN